MSIPEDSATRDISPEIMLAVTPTSFQRLHHAAVKARECNDNLKRLGEAFGRASSIEAKT